MRQLWSGEKHESMSRGLGLSPTNPQCTGLWSAVRVDCLSGAASSLNSLYCLSYKLRLNYCWVIMFRRLIGTFLALNEKCVTHYSAGSWNWCYFFFTCYPAASFIFKGIFVFFQKSHRCLLSAWNNKAFPGAKSTFNFHWALHWPGMTCRLRQTTKCN